jgi:hypothetical protein
MPSTIQHPPGRIIVSAILDRLQRIVKGGHDSAAHVEDHVYQYVAAGDVKGFRPWKVHISRVPSLFQILPKDSLSHSGWDGLARN